MVRARTLVPGPVAVFTFVVLACSVVAGCSSDASDGVARRTTTTRPGATTTLPPTVPETVDPSPAGLPAGALEPSGPEWAGACKLGDSLVTQAWQLQGGELTDPTVVGGTLLAMIDQVPAGAADDEVAFVGQLVTAFVSGGDVSAYQADFRAQADSLLAKVAAGCGVADGASLPLPPDVVGTIERFLFG